MKEFMMIFVGAPYDDLSPQEIQERLGKWFAWHGKMEAAGIIKSSEALQPKVKRISGEDRVVADGPFVESKEVVGGFYVIRAESVEKVIEIAQDFPEYDIGGSVEIREVMTFDQ